MDILIYPFTKLPFALTTLRKKQFENIALGPIYHTIPAYNDPTEEGFGKHCGKGVNAGNQHLLLFPQCFLLYQREKSSF